MPRITTLQTNFTAGVLSERLHGRVDIAKYGNGAKALENCYPTVHGGALGRGGFKHLGEVKDSTSDAVRPRLIPFTGPSINAVLEFGDFYMRVWSTSGRNTDVDLVTPFSAAQARSLDYSQNGDQLILVGANDYPQVVTYRGILTTGWSIGPLATIQEPVAEIGQRGTSTLTLTTAAVGAATATSTGEFLAADVGRTLVERFGTGYATITNYTSTNSVDISTVVAWTGTSVAAAFPGWIIEGTPQTTCTPTASGPVGTVTQLTLGAAGWRANEVGSLVELNGGLFKITAFTSTTVVDARVLRVATSTVAAAADSWTLKRGLWSTAGGGDAEMFAFPATCCFHEQRLFVCAYGGVYGKTVIGSATGRYLDFTPGTLDDDAVYYQLAADDVQSVRYLSSDRSLVAFCDGGEVTLHGGIEKPLTPTNVQARLRSNHGTSGVRPVRIGFEEVFMQRAARKVRAFGYNVSNDDYTAPDVSILAEHITEGGIVDLQWQQEPDALLWATRADGSLVSITFSRDQDVMGFALHTTQGDFESICCIPGTGRDDLFAVVKRTINGTVKRFVEVLTDGLYPDCALSLTAGSPSTSWSAPHLAGQACYLICDGSVQADVTPAAGGAFTTRAASSVQIGLRYTRTIDLLTPEIGGPQGSAQGNSMRTSEVSIRMLDTVGLQVQGGGGPAQELPFRNLDTDILDQPPQPFSGLKRLPTMLGWDRGESALKIMQADPLGFHILGVIRKFEANS